MVPREQSSPGWHETWPQPLPLFSWEGGRSNQYVSHISSYIYIYVSLSLSLWCRFSTSSSQVCYLKHFESKGDSGQLNFSIKKPTKKRTKLIGSLSSESTGILRHFTGKLGGSTPKKMGGCSGKMCLVKYRCENLFKAWNRQPKTKLRTY